MSVLTNGDASPPGSPDPSWCLRLLGSPELRCGQQHVRIERRAAAALAYVALGTATSRRGLAGLLWPDTHDGQLLNNLRQLLRRLRLTCPQAPPLVEGASRELLSLGPSVRCDLVTLRKRGEPASLVQLLELQGELLGGLVFDDLPEFARWLDGARMEVASTQRKLLHAGLTRREHAGELTDALQLAEHWLRGEPESDEAVQAVMRLQFRLGARRTALETYERYRTCLARELGVGPAPAVAALAHALRSSVGQLRPVPSEDLPPGDGPALLAMPEALPLVGRAQAWAQLEQARRLGRQVMCLHGPPGIGKSRLARELADRVGPACWVLGRSGDASVPGATLARALRKHLARLTPAKLPAWARRELTPLLPELSDGARGGGKHHRAGLHVRRLHALCLALDAMLADSALLVVEDLQSWDVESQEVLRAWLAEGDATPRPPAVLTWSGLRLPEVLETLGADTLAEAAWVELGALSFADVAALVASSPGAEPQRPRADVLWELAGGNPRLLVQALREHAEGLSGAGVERVRALARVHVQRLHPDAPAILEGLGPCCATPANLQAVAATLQLSSRDVLHVAEQLRRAGLVLGSGPGEGRVCSAAAAPVAPGAWPAPPSRIEPAAPSARGPAPALRAVWSA